jgi:uncharacterized protein (DUF2147 family)
MSSSYHASILGIAFLTLAPANGGAQGVPTGCWRVEDTGHSINQLGPCQQDTETLCVKVFAKAGSGRPDQNDVGKSIVQGATKDTTLPNTWVGDISVFALNEKKARMQLTIESPQRLSVKGCYAWYPCLTFQWSKVSCRR